MSGPLLFCTVCVCFDKMPSIPEEDPGQDPKKCLTDLSTLVDEILSTYLTAFEEPDKAELISSSRDFLEETNDAVSAKSKTTLKSVAKSKCADDNNNNNVLTSSQAKRETQSDSGCGAGQ